MILSQPPIVLLHLHNRPTTQTIGSHNCSTMQVIGKNVKKFKETEVITNIEGPVHHRFARSAENIAIVSESVAEDQNVSIPCRSLELGMTYNTLCRILHLNVQLHPYKVQLTRQLKPADHSQRHRYVEWILEQHAIFRTKFSSVMKYISNSVGMLINKIVVFGFLTILK